MNKEDFLDKKNIDVIREVRYAINLRSELDATFKYIRDMERGSDLPICEFYNKPTKDMPRVGSSVLQIAMNLAKAYFENRLVFKDALKKKTKESVYSSCTETNTGKANLYYRDSHGNWYDSNLDPIESARITDDN